MPIASLSTSAPGRNLQRLVLIRSLLLGILCVTLAVSYQWLQLDLPYGALIWIISGMTLVNMTVVLQLRWVRHPSQRSFFLQLLFDVVAVSLLLFFTGGANNPFVPYYLVPLCIAAATLPWFYTWPLLVCSLTLYSSLFFFYLPLPVLAPEDAMHHMHGNTAMVSLHSLGMWINFFISALLVIIFVGRMAHSLRQQDAALAQLREEQLRDQQLMALAALAAGTAHELGTPLTTIRTLLSELQQDCEDNTVDRDTLRQDLAILQTQANHCSQSLKALGRQASEMQSGEIPKRSLVSVCQQVIDHWQLLRPEVDATVTIQNDGTDPHVVWPATITQAMGNLLNNASDANPRGITVEARWDAHQFYFTIQDQGPGLDPQLAHRLLQPFVTHKGEGRGLGLFLTDAVVRRFGGKLDLHQPASGGTMTELTLPLG